MFYSYAFQILFYSSISESAVFVRACNYLCPALSFSFSRDAETKENGVDESQHGTKEKNLQAGAMRRGKKVARLLFVFLVDG